jgi:hypothetical protein
MVKAIKRRDKSADAPSEMPKKSMKDKNLGKIVILVTMALIVIGFTMNVPNVGKNNQPQEPEIPETSVDYGVGVGVGIQEAEVSSTGNGKAIFGQLNVPQDAERRLDGDLYFLDGGLSQLILTNKSVAEIGAVVSGNYILYDVAFCGLFDCLVEEVVNGTVTFDVYELDVTSDFLKTTMLGLPTVDG